MTDVIVVAVLVLIVAFTAGYIIRAKRRGAKCIGCPDSGSCGKKQEACPSCGCGCAGTDAGMCSGCHTKK